MRYSRLRLMSEWSDSYLMAYIEWKWVRSSGRSNKLPTSTTTTTTNNTSTYRLVLDDDICVAVCRICRRILVLHKFAILPLLLSILIVFPFQLHQTKLSNISII